MFRHKSTLYFLIAVLAVFGGITLVNLLYALAMGLGIDLAEALILPCILTIPAAIIGWFILSLVLYLRAQKQVSPDLPALKSRLTVASVLLGFLIAVVTALVAVFAMAIAFM